MSSDSYRLELKVSTVHRVRRDVIDIDQSALIMRAEPARRLSHIRPLAAWTFGLCGLALYNWWVLLPLKPGLMRSPNELFSDLEVTGQPFATSMQHADLLAGLLLMAAFLAAGSRAIRGGRREWVAMVIFAASGTFGGVFPEVCADGVSAVCRSMELRFQLPLSQYLHLVAGILEFGAITIALLFAFRRTHDLQTRSAKTYRYLARAAYVAYPILGLAYLLNKLGSIPEAAFFVGFTVIVITELLERTSTQLPEEPRANEEANREYHVSGA
jgi:hypothetical protein